jgi:hypothetical protein
MKWDFDLFRISIRHAESRTKLAHGGIFAIVLLGLSVWAFAKHKQTMTRQSFRIFLGTRTILAGFSLVSCGDFFVPFWFAHYRAYLCIRLVAYCVLFGGLYQIVQNESPIKSLWQPDAQTARTESRLGIASVLLAGLVLLNMTAVVLLKRPLLSARADDSFVFGGCILGCILGVLGIRERNRSEFCSMLGIVFNLLLLIGITLPIAFLEGTGAK